MPIYIDRKIHRVWFDWYHLSDGYKEGLPPRYNQPLVGKYQYTVSNEKGHKISIVELPNYFRDGVTLWEIYCLKGDLFDDIERFGSYDEALTAAKEFLLNSRNINNKNNAITKNKR